MHAKNDIKHNTSDTISLFTGPFVAFPPWPDTLMYTVSRVILVFALLDVFVGVSAQAIDTSYADVTVQTLDMNSNQALKDVSVKLYPDNMEMVLLDTSFTQITDILGNAYFSNIPMFVNTATTITEISELFQPGIINTIGGTINIVFPRASQGHIKVYNLNGQLVRENDFTGKNVQVPLFDLSPGLYIYQTQTNSGDKLVGKFMNNKNPSIGDLSSYQKNLPQQSLKVASMFTADFWAVYDKPGFYKDSTLITINDGNNGTIPMYLTPIPQDTLWATGNFITVDTNNLPVSNVSLMAKSHNLSTIDTLIQLSTDTNGQASFQFPLLVDLVTQLPASTTGDYWVKWQKQDFDTDSSLVNLSSGNNGNINLILTPSPLPQNVDLKVRVRNMDRDSLENVLMVLKEQTTGNIDTLRSDSNGLILFEDLPLGKTYFWEVGGKIGYLAWGGIISTPSTITSATDTLIQKNYVMIADTIHSFLNNVDVGINALQAREMFSNFNIQLSLYDTAFAHFKPAYWTSSQIAILENAQQTLSQQIGIPIQSFSTPFDLDAISNYDPWTTDPHLVGTNFVGGGGDHTYKKYYGFTPSSSYWGDYVIMACDSIRISSILNAFAKEHFRWFGAEDVSSRSSVMNATAQAMNDMDAALLHMFYQLGRNRYQFLVHDINSVSFLRDTIMLISAPMMTSVDNESSTPLHGTDCKSAPARETITYSFTSLPEKSPFTRTMYIPGAKPLIFNFTSCCLPFICISTRPVKSMI